MRWMAQLAQFQFEVKYRKGHENRNADALSRRPLDRQTRQTVDRGDMDAIFVKYTGTSIPREVQVSKVEAVETVNTQSTLPVLSSESLCELQGQDTEISRLVSFWKKGLRPTETQVMREVPAVRKLLRQWSRLKEQGGVLYRTLSCRGRSTIS